MASTVFSFCVKEKDTTNKKRVEALRDYAESKGISFSGVVLKSLELYEKELNLIWQPKQK